MPLHDWTGLPGWEGMRVFWMTEIARALRGSLPPGYRTVITDMNRNPSGIGPLLPESPTSIDDIDTTEEMVTIAEHYGTRFVDVTALTIPESVIELVPESVARENIVLPLELEGNTLLILTADPTNYDTVQKLQFILNKEILPLLAFRKQIQDAINRYYGQSEVEFSPEESLTVLVERNERLVAAVELISPRHKDDLIVRELCAARYLKYLRRGVCLMLVDIHRRPLGFSFAQRIAEGLCETLPAPSSPSVVSYRAGAAQGDRRPSVWQHALTVGEDFAPIPLPLGPDEAVMVDLEATYTRAAAGNYLT